VDGGGNMPPRNAIHKSASVCEVEKGRHAGMASRELLERYIHAKLGGRLCAGRQIRHFSGCSNARRWMKCFEIFRAMIQCSVEREKATRKEKRRQPRRDVVMTGFLHQLEKMATPNQDAEFASDLDQEIRSAECIIEIMQGLKCWDKRELKSALASQADHIDQLRAMRGRIGTGKPFSQDARDVKNTLDDQPA